MTNTSNENNNIETLLLSIGTQQNNAAFNFQQQNFIETNVSLNQIANKMSNVFREEFFLE